MPTGPMVPVATAANSFAARVIAARLGSEGIPWELRGNVDGPYPVGEVVVLVDVADEESARELLLADEVEYALEHGDRGELDERAPRELWFLVLAIVALAVFSLARMFGAGY